MFQSTFPQGERRSTCWTVISVSSLFQSTFPQGERPTSRVSCAFLSRFNPRSRKGNDDNADISRRDRVVSIHVPARGTTESSAWKTKLSECFNPRSRKGNDHPGNDAGHVYDVSIHVPARGTTVWRCFLCMYRMFQSTFPQGERPLGDTIKK